MICYIDKRLLVLQILDKNTLVQNLTVCSGKGTTVHLKTQIEENLLLYLANHKLHHKRLEEPHTAKVVQNSTIS